MNRIAVVSILAALAMCFFASAVVGAVEIARWSAEWLAGASR